MANTTSAFCKPSDSSARSGVHSPVRQPPDPLHSRNLSPNSAAMLGGSGKYSWSAWNSPNASSDNLSNHTASISSSSSPVDSAPLTDSPHCSPLNVVWDTTPKVPTLGPRGYPALGEWSTTCLVAPAVERLEIPANHFAIRPTRQQQIASSQASALSANPNAQDAVGRYPSTAPHKSAIQHSSIGSNASGYSSGLPAVPFDSIQTSDPDAELAEGMILLSVDESAPRSSHNFNHGRAVTYAGGFGVSDV
ncbi:hypothetical protein FRC08_016706 [Ceratobasidium sp. 394]|nr:hypothetical protein FRC08_016706 [Ceratobasidium sp. 394]